MALASGIYLVRESPQFQLIFAVISICPLDHNRRHHQNQDHPVYPPEFAFVFRFYPA